nr:hypothetical protein [Tanacetum cinerariifolium]
METGLRACLASGVGQAVGLVPTAKGTNRSKGDQVQSSHDSPLSSGHTSDRAEGSLDIKELFSICTNLSNRVLALETVNDAQAAEIIALKARIKKLEKRCKPSISNHRAWLKSGRLSEETEELVSTARPGDSTIRMDIGTADQIVPLITTTHIFSNEDITMAQTLIKMKEEKAKEKGVSIKDIEDTSRPARSILTLKPLPTIDPKDKGKGVLEEPEPAKKIRRIEADALFTAKLQQKEREEYTIKERAKFLADTITAQRKSVLHKDLPRLEVCMKDRKRMIDDFKPMDSDDAVEKEKVLEELDNTKSEIVLDEEGEVDYEVLDKRFPIINYDSKFYYLDRHGVECIYYRIFRSDGSSRWIKTFSKMVTRFDRMDLEELYNLVMQRFETTTAEERSYPLTKETLKRMLALRLIAECESEAIFDLLRFIQKQINESRSHDGSEKDIAPCYCNEALAILEQTAIDDKDRKLIKEKFKKLQCVLIHPLGVQEAQDEET